MRSCTIIVPVYNSFAEARICLESVLDQTDGRYRLLVIDDASPEGDFAEFLPDAVRSDTRVTLRRNAENLGFVGTCNAGMRWAGDDDIVLLNSDTEVTAGWLGRMRHAAYSSPRVGSVTPWTNNGEICSLPRSLVDNPLPPGYTAAELAAVIEQSAAREYPALPTCIGFCVYLKREMLDRVGLFDEESFGRGYGEENDLSCRAQAAGYADILDDATFVYHKGRMSFRDETAHLSARNLAVLERKHPGYQQRIQDFVMSDPLQAARGRVQDAILRRWMERRNYSVLHLLHKEPITQPGPNQPGGVELHVADLVATVPAAHWSFYADERGYALKAHAPGFERTFSFAAEGFELSRLLNPGLFDVVHLHHASRFPYEALTAALRRHGRYFVSLHDFALCCPNYHLVDRQGRYCGPDHCPQGCPEGADGVRRRHATTARLFRDAHSLFHFSASTRRHYAERVGDDYRWRLLEHGIRLAETPGARSSARGRVPQPGPDEPLKVAFLGGISTIKGSGLVRELARHARLASGVPVEWHLIGLFEGPVPDNVVDHGRYVRDELPAVIGRVRPHLVAIASICPETYCYTLEESLACGIPTLVTPLGAPAERVREYGAGWVLDELTAPAFLGRLEQIVARWDEYQAVRRRVSVLPLRKVDQVGARYHESYRLACPRQKAGAAAVLAAIADLERRAPAAPGPARVLAGRMLNGSLRLLGVGGARRLTVHVASRLLPGRWHRALQQMRVAAARGASPADAPE